MSDWKYLRLTIDIAIDGTDHPARAERLAKALLDERAPNRDLEDAIRDGWIEIDGYSKVEDHTE